MHDLIRNQRAELAPEHRQHETTWSKLETEFSVFNIIQNFEKP